MSKFHITKGGKAAECDATKRACPLGGEHYDSMREAAIAMAGEARSADATTRQRSGPEKTAVEEQDPRESARELLSKLPAEMAIPLLDEAQRRGLLHHLEATDASLYTELLGAIENERVPWPERMEFLTKEELLETYDSLRILSEDVVVPHFPEPLSYEDCLNVSEAYYDTLCEMAEADLNENIDRAMKTYAEDLLPEDAWFSYSRAQDVVEDAEVPDGSVHGLFRYWQAHHAEGEHQGAREFLEHMYRAGYDGEEALAEAYASHLRTGSPPPATF